MTRIRKCIICGKQYHYCPSCGDGDMKESWRFLYDSEDCRTLFDVCSKFDNGKLSLSNAKKQLSKLTVPPISEVGISVHGALSKIIESDQKN